MFEKLYSASMKFAVGIVSSDLYNTYTKKMVESVESRLALSIEGNYSISPTQPESDSTSPLQSCTFIAGIDELRAGSN